MNIMGEYTKTVWDAGDKINKGELNNMEDGIKHANENLISYGNGAPTGGENNDFYIDNDSNSIYFKEGGSWTEVQTFIDRDIGQGLRFIPDGRLEVGLGNGLEFDSADAIEVDPAAFAGAGLKEESGFIRLDIIASDSFSLVAGGTTAIPVNADSPFYVSYRVIHDDTSGDAKVEYTQVYMGYDSNQRIQFENVGDADCIVEYEVIRTGL